MGVWSWRALPGLCVLVALSVGSACSGPAGNPPACTTPPPAGDRTSVGAAPPPAAAGPSADRPVERVRVTVPTKSLTFLPFYFGQSRDLYRAEGIDLELIQMRPPAGITALDAGDVEYSAAPGVGMRAALQGAPLRAIMFAQAKPSFSLLRQPGLPPERIRTVAVSSLRSTAHYAAMAVMRSLGRGGPDDVTYFATNDTSNSYQALVAQAADAAILSPPYTTMATLAGYVYLGDAFDMADVQGGLVTTTRRLQEQPGQVKAVLRGT